MKHVKILSLVAMLLGLAVITAPAAQDQYGLLSTSIAGGTNNVAQDATNAYTAVTTCTKWGSVIVEATFKAGGAGVSNVVFTAEESADGTNYTSGRHRLTIAGNGTGTAVLLTNISVQGGYFKLTGVENGFKNTYLTNVTFKTYGKPVRQGANP